MDGIDGRLDGLYVRSHLVSDEALDDFVEGSNHGVQVVPPVSRTSTSMPRKGVDKFKGQRGVCF